MKAKALNLSRRQLLKGGVLVVGAAIAGATARRTLAQSKAAKTAFQYQDRPKDGKKCANCSLFIPSTGGGSGQCKVVEGDINPNGWCVAFVEAPKK